MIGKRRTGGVNMLHLPSHTYGEVQGQIFDLVAEHLPADRVTHTIGRPAGDALNWVLHIRLGKQHKQLPPPAQVVMSHGLADKSYLFVRNYRTGEPLLNSFEHVLVPGEFLKRRVIERSKLKDRTKRLYMTEDNVHVVGWPRLDPLVQAGAAVRQPVQDRPLRVLWAPSHDSTRLGPEQKRLSSYPEFEQYLPQLQERFDVRVSLHPRNRTDKTPTQGAMTWADIVIGDFGTTLYEGWALNKCVIMPSWLMPPQITTRLSHTAEAHVYRERIGNHASSIDELIEMAEANEPPGTDVKQFLDDYLAPEHLGTSARRIAEVLDRLAPPTQWTWRPDPQLLAGAVGTLKRTVRKGLAATRSSRHALSGGRPTGGGSGRVRSPGGP